MSEETTETFQKPILEAIADLSKRFDTFERNTNDQFEAIRRGIAHNSAAFDRMEAKVLLLRADVKELSEEIRQIKSPV